MTRMIAYCGLSCSDCPTFVATQNHDDQKRREVAKLWSKVYQADIRPQDINCDGCLSQGQRLFSHCKVCAIRSCGREKAVANCAACDQSPCPKLLELFKLAPEAKANLDRLQAGD